MAKTSIRVTTSITGYSKKKGKGNFGLKIGSLKLTEAQRNKLDPIIDNGDTVILTIETEQENLPGM